MLISVIMKPLNNQERLNKMGPDTLDEQIEAFMASIGINNYILSATTADQSLQSARFNSVHDTGICIIEAKELINKSMDALVDKVSGKGVGVNVH